jgi:holo-[acyl-carrier protein] synthase
MLGIGTDIVAVARIASVLSRHDQRFLQRCFREGEIALAAGRGGLSAAETLAARWAAKEAFLKALGVAAAGVRLRDIEVVRAENGPSRLALHGTARAAVRSLAAVQVHLSISHEKDYAVAIVILE